MTHPLWQPPQIHPDWTAANEEEERKVTWLELFYDLVYVATLIQLGNTLSSDVSMIGFLKFAALFVPIWWSWTGSTFLVNQFVVDDIVHRGLVFIQIMGIATLGVSIAGAFGDLANQFAGGYILIRLILIIQYLRASKHAPTGRPLSDLFAKGYSVAILFWIISLFVPAPAKYALWTLGMIIDVVVPSLPQATKIILKFPPHVPHMEERYALFTIIVLGESFVKVIDEVSGQQIGLMSYVFTFFGVGVTSALWWLYFDDVAEQKIKEGRASLFVWVYAHLPLALALIAFGVGAKKVFIQAPLEPLTDKYRILYCVAVVLYLIIVAVIDLVTEREDTESLDNQHRAYWRFGAAAIILGIGLFGTFLTPISFIIALAVVFAIQIVIDLPKRTQSASI
ncbi:MAG: low temperature requirement protein A [Chloroflexota bacterium]